MRRILSHERIALAFWCPTIPAKPSRLSILASCSINLDEISQIGRGYGRPGLTINASVRRSAANLTDSELMDIIAAGEEQDGAADDAESEKTHGPH